MINQQKRIEIGSIMGLDNKNKWALLALPQQQGNITFMCGMSCQPELTKEVFHIEIVRLCHDLSDCEVQWRRRRGSMLRTQRRWKMIWWLHESRATASNGIQKWAVESSHVWSKTKTNKTALTISSIAAIISEGMDGDTHLHVRRQKAMNTAALVAELESKMCQQRILRTVMSNHVKVCEIGQDVFDKIVHYIG